MQRLGLSFTSLVFGCAGVGFIVCAFVVPVSSKGIRADPRLSKIKELEHSVSITDPNAYEKICEARRLSLELLGEAPLEAPGILRFVGIDDLTQAAPCTNEPRKYSRSEVIDFAVSLQPKNRGVLLAAAMLEHRSMKASVDEDDFAASIEQVTHQTRREEFLKRALATAGEFTDQHRGVLDQELDSDGVIIAAAAPTMRQAILVSQVKFGADNSKRPSVDPSIQGVIEGLQLRAIETATKDYTVEDESLVLATLQRYAASNEVKRRIDVRRSEIATKLNQEKLSEFFKARSELKELDVLRGVIWADPNPKTGSITRWRRNEDVIFDIRGRSIGAALENNVSIHAAQLQSLQLESALQQDEVQIWVSSDNVSWSLVPMGRWLTAEVDSKSVTLIVFSEPISARFLKVNFIAPINRKQFRNDSSNLLQVFGDE